MKRSESARGVSHKPTSWRAALQEASAIVWTHRYRLGVGLAILFVGRVAGLALPAISKYFVDEVLVSRRADLLPLMAVLAAGGTLVHSVTSFVLARLIGIATERTIVDMRRRIQRQVAYLPASYFDGNSTGSVLARIMVDPEGLRNLIGSGLLQLVGGLFTAVVSLAILLYINWRLTLLTLVMLSLFAVVITKAFVWLRPLFLERREIFAEVNGRLAEAVAGNRIVKCYTAEKKEEFKFTLGVHRLYRKVAETITASALVGSMAILIIGVIAVVMIVVGGRAIVAGTMTLGDFVMYAAFTGMMVSPIVRIAGQSTRLSEALASIDRMHEILSMVRENEGDSSKPPLEEVRGEIVFDDVDFEYENGVPVLKNVSFRAPVGTTTALVGPSGAGKSTLINLVMLFHKPGAGTILLDGRDLETVRLRDYRAHLGVVLQDNFLFDGTVAENIGYGAHHATFEEIEAVSRIAHCHEFVVQMPDGYETVVGERGVRLSGGQRQRIAIARAILADPTILILDEATSNLDSESESLIQDGLRTLRQGRTTFVIAHRLSTIRSADQILVLDRGEIVERGTHEELLTRGGLYQRLYERQYQLERNQFVNPGEDPSEELVEASALDDGAAEDPMGDEGFFGLR